MKQKYKQLNSCKLNKKENQKMNENQTNVQANQENQQNQQMVEKMVQESNQVKTVMNGKIVPLKDAQATEEQFNKQNTSTGIQQHHDNSSESVPAGEVAKNQQQFQQTSQQEQNIKQTNVQSGQSHLSQSQVQAQQDHQTIQSYY